MNRSFRFALLLLLSWAGAQGLRDFAPSGVKVGTAFPPRAMADATFLEVVDREFNLVTVTWFPRFIGWNQPGPLPLSNLNAGVNWGKAHGKEVWLHLLLGNDQYMPDWWIKASNRSPGEDERLLQRLVEEPLSTNDNANKIDLINVANELFDNRGKYRTNLFLTRMGWEEDASGLTGSDAVNPRHPVFVGKAFRACRRLSKARLELRDYYFEALTNATFQGKFEGMFQLVKHMKAMGHPLDAVSVQAHYNVGNGDRPLRDLAEMVRRYEALGVEVTLSEIDVGTKGAPWTEELALRQKEDFRLLVKKGLECGVRSFNFWGVRDGMDRGWRTNEKPLLFDENFRAKPAWEGVAEALREGAKGR